MQCKKSKLTKSHICIDFCVWPSWTFLYKYTFQNYIFYANIYVCHNHFSVNKSNCIIHPFSDMHFKHCYCFVCGESCKLIVALYYFLYKCWKHFKQLSTSSDHKTNLAAFYTTVLTFIDKPTSNTCGLSACITLYFSCYLSMIISKHTLLHIILIITQARFHKVRQCF